MENGLTGLFDGWEETMVWTCLQGHMGQVVAEGGPPPVSALCAVGDFCFLAGFPSRTLAAQADRPILVPRTMDWIPVIRSVWGTRAVPFLRYAIRKEPDVFDRSWLADCAATLPEGVILSPIRAAHIPLLMSQPWSRDLCGNFRDGADFVRCGLGVLALWDGVPVAGAASYTVYDGGIEIEIDTRPDLRRRGLALACGARLILDCLDRGLYPSWDAHDLRSVALAEKLGGEINAMMRTTFAFTMAQGSKQINVMPNEATAGVNVRLINADTPDSVQAYMQQVAGGENVTVTVRDAQQASPYASTEGEHWNKLAKAVAHTWQGCLVSPYLMIACSDSRHYAGFCEDVYKFSAMHLSAQQRGLIHNDDERIPVAEVAKTVEFFTRLEKSL